MLDKLETVLRTKGVLVRKPKIESSEDESDNERNKSNLISTRELPLIPTSSSSCLVDTYYSTPENSPKFNFNCLTSLGCGTSTYEAVKEPNSLFFISCKKEEPVYAEPFEYQVAKDENVKDCHTDDCAIDGGEATFNAKTIRHSLHYASSPVPDLKAEDVDHVSDLKNQEQVCGSFDSNSSTSDMDSSISSPSEENKTLVSNTKVKELISAIENCNKSVVSRTNSNSSTTEKNNHNNTLITNNDHIKKLETHLKNVCEKSFTLPSPNNHESSDIDVDEDSENKKETKKFKTYVQRIRSKIFNSSPSKKDHLFYCCLLVALDRSSPYVKSKFPQTVQEPHKIAELCFPEVESGPMDTGTEAQCYSLIITNELGERTFGYCRRVLPEGSTACLPLAYCILSKHRAPGFYRRILEELEHRHGYPDMFIDAFIQELYNCKFPMPGDTMVIDCSKIITASCDKMKYKTLKSLSNKNNELPNSTNIIKGNIDRLKLTCDKDNLLQRNNTSEDSDMAIEKNSNHAELDLKSFVIVCNSGEYGTLLRSHKDNNTRGNSAIINVPYEIPATKLKRSTSSPNLLSDMESLPSEVVLMRPFDSRHEENDLMLLGDTLKTPILQQVFCSLLLERKVILVSNMLSKLSSCIEALQMILYPFSWQHTIIPVLPQSLWEIVDTPTPLVCGVLSAEVVNDYEIKNGIVVDLDSSTVLQQVGDEDRILPSSLVQTLKDGLSLASKIASSNSGAHNIFFSDAFLRVFIQTCGHYKEFIVDGDFKKSNFMEYCKHKGKRNRLFLKWFTETSMFYNFIETALTNSNNLDLFDQRIKIYSSQSAVEILSKMKNWSGYKGFLSSTLIRFQ